MKVYELDYELSLRLGDPVDSPDADGNVFHSSERMKYLTRAYSKLIRMFRLLMRDYQPEFAKAMSIMNSKIAVAASSITVPNAIDIKEIFVDIRYLDGSTVRTATYPCARMDAAKYLSYKNGVNDIKEPVWNDFKFRYALFPSFSEDSMTIRFLPEATSSNYYTSAEILSTPDISKLDWNSELALTRDYLDLLIDMAAVQGMQDIARQDKVALFNQSIQQELQILGQYGTYMKQTEGVAE